MTGMQWLIWSLAAAGKFFEGFVVFMTGVALPLFSNEFNLGAAEHGVIGAASLFGIPVGAVGLGGLSDRFGRKTMFVAEMIIFCGFLALLCVSRSYLQIVICLFGLGLALGCDYPTAHMIISETIPSTSRGKLVLGAFAFQAVGALGGTAVGYAVLSTLPEISAWRWMFASALIPAVLVTIGRFYIVESPNWLSVRGETAKAEQAVKQLLVRTPQYPTEVKLAARGKASANASSQQTYASLFNSVNRRATILASVPWFLQDLGTYGIGIFTPTILAAALGANSDHPRSVHDLILNDITAAQGAALITSLLIIGILFAVMLADVVGRIWLQGFRLHRLRGGSVHRIPVDILCWRRSDAVDLRRFHAVQLHDQPRTERTDLPPGWRGVPHGDPRKGREIRSRVREDRGGHDRVPVSRSSRHDRDATPALLPRRDIAFGRCGDLDVPHRDNRHQPRHARSLIRGRKHHGQVKWRGAHE